MYGENLVKGTVRMKSLGRLLSTTVKIFNHCFLLMTLNLVDTHICHHITQHI